MALVIPPNSPKKVINVELCIYVFLFDAKVGWWELWVCEIVHDCLVLDVFCGCCFNVLRFA